MTVEVFRLLALSILYAAVSGYGLLFLKQAEIGLNLKLSLGALLYGSGFLIWLWILRGHPLSVSFPVTAGSLMVATQLLGATIGESFTVSKTVGVCLILGGIALVSLDPFK